MSNSLNSSSLALILSDFNEFNEACEVSMVELMNDLDDNVEEGNVASNDNSIGKHIDLQPVIDPLAIEQYDEEGVNSLTLIKEAEESELLFAKVNNDEEAYKLYNDYAFRKGFSIRKGKLRKRVDGGWSMRQLVCSNEGSKDNSNNKPRAYNKMDVRTNWGAYIQFNIDKKGEWTCTKHCMEHNHVMIPAEKRQLLRSQRKISHEQLQFMSTMKSSGVKLADAMRIMRKEVGGSPMIGFTPRDAYNAVNSEKAKHLDGKDC